VKLKSVHLDKSHLPATLPFTLEVNYGNSKHKKALRIPVSRKKKKTCGVKSHHNICLYASLKAITAISAQRGG
jgi:hypothetical protein